METFTANRLSNGNKLFPDKIQITEHGVTLKLSGFLGGAEKSLSFRDIASVRIDSGIIGFSTISFETLGFNRAIAHGFSNSDAQAIKELVQQGISGNSNGGYSNPQQSYIQVETKSAEQIRAEADAERVRHDIEQEKRDKRNEEDKKFYAGMAKYWYIWTPILAAIIIWFVYQDKNKDNNIKSAAEINLKLESIEDQIKIAIQNGDKTKALELTNQLVNPVHEIYQAKGTTFKTEYYDTYWEKKREIYKSLIIDGKPQQESSN